MEPSKAAFSYGEILARTRSLASKVTGIPADQISETDDFRNDLGADSLTMFEFRLIIEQEFGIQIEDEEVRNLTTIQQSAYYLHQVLGN